MSGAAEPGASREGGSALPDLVPPDARVLFCGINPGRHSAAAGHHFAGPGNRFWRVLHAAGFTDRVLHPSEDATLPALGYGLTNLVPRTTASAAELTAAECRAGALRLRERLERWRPRWLAVLGVGAYRAGFGLRGAGIGAQPERLGSTRVWLLPNPSGLNARYTLADLASAYAALRDAAGD